MVDTLRNEITFGSGDVCIFLSGETGCGRLIMRNQKPIKIGRYRKAKTKDAQLTITESDFVMKFSNPASIDALIFSLQKIKEQSFPDNE